MYNEYSPVTAPINDAFYGGLLFAYDAVKEEPKNEEEVEEMKGESDNRARAPSIPRLTSDLLRPDVTHEICS